MLEYAALTAVFHLGPQT